MSNHKIQHRLNKKSIPFTQVPNEMINDNSIRGVDKGVYCYISSKPEGWNFSAYRIAEDFLDKIDAIKSSLKRLEKAGWLTREKRNNGRVDYFLNIVPTPKVEKSTMDNSLGGKNRPVSNKEINKKRELNNKDIKDKSSSLSMEDFKLFNAYKNKQSPRKGTNPFYYFLICHDNYWQQKHAPIKDDTVKKYSSIVSKIIGDERSSTESKATQFFKECSSGDFQFPLFVHWLFSEYDEDYRGFNIDGASKLGVDEMELAIELN